MVNPSWKGPRSDCRELPELQQALMPIDAIIRSANADDEAAIGHLGAMLVREHHDFDPKRFIAPVPNLASRYGQFLVSQTMKDDRVVLVAESSGRVVGYVYGGMEGNDYMALRGPAGMIYDILVDPQERRKGIGNALLNQAIQLLRKLGAPRVLLFTAQKNTIAQQIFEGAGFRRTMIEMTREFDDEN